MLRSSCYALHGKILVVIMIAITLITQYHKMYAHTTWHNPHGHHDHSEWTPDDRQAL